MKKPKPLEIKEEASLRARRRARLAVGPVKPGGRMLPKTLKPPRHKKRELEDQAS